MLDQLAALATIRGDTAEAIVFTDAAALVTAHAILTDNDLGTLLEDPPAGATDAAMRVLRQIHESAGWVVLESALADLPGDLRRLFESGAVTIEQLAALHHELDVTAAGDIALGVASGALRNVPNIGPEIEAAIAAALPLMRDARSRIPLGRALGLVEPLLERLRSLGSVRWAHPIGSLRRGQDTVGDVEIVAATDDAEAAFETLRTFDPEVRSVYTSPTKIYVLIDRTQVGLRCPPVETAGAALLFLTGSRAHLAGLQQRARARGWSLEARGLARGAGVPLIGDSEEAIYDALDLRLVPPEIREDDREIELAAAGTLPKLVARPDVRGDLHLHTQWSDGRDTTEAIVLAAVALGYEYVAITDHSARAAAARTLAVADVARQADEIAGLRERYPQIAILHGCEVDIMPDGRLDFGDGVLERFDIVLASLHDRAGHSPEQLMQRYLAAVNHPLVTMITHPTNRMVPYRAGYDLDYDRLFAAAAETGTLVEVDGAPAHLDLDGALARRAVARGATLATDSDSHRDELMPRQMEMALTTARRGWVEPRHVANTRPVEEIHAIVRAKRER
jgi:DNA polymerase (family 10)